MASRVASLVASREASVASRMASRMASRVASYNSCGLPRGHPAWHTQTAQDDGELHTLIFRSCDGQEQSESLRDGTTQDLKNS